MYIKSQNYVCHRDYKYCAEWQITERLYRMLRVISLCDIMLNITLPSGIMFSNIIINIVGLNVIMLCVVVLSITLLSVNILIFVKLSVNLHSISMSFC
jgi:hypothetical protein